MNTAYYPIVVAVIQFIGTLLYFSWKKGQDDQKLEVLRTAHNEVTEDLDRLKDVVVELERELGNIRGYLRGSTGAPINGGH